MLHDTTEELASQSLTTGELTHQETLPRTFFILEDKYELLKRYQRQIFELTELTPNIRKLVNALITTENLEKLKLDMVELLSK